MKRNRHDADLGNFIAEARAKQSNNVWPDPLRNGRALDDFLWRGSENPTLVQKIGAWIIGLATFALGVEFLGLGLKGRSLLEVLFSIAVLSLGVKTFLCGFRRRKRTSPDPPAPIRR
jgi:hypothetical protein